VRFGRSRKRLKKNGALYDQTLVPRDIVSGPTRLGQSSGEACRSPRRDDTDSPEKVNLSAASLRFELLTMLRPKSTAGTLRALVRSDVDPLLLFEAPPSLSGISPEMARSCWTRL